jgi:glucose dehydrogenase
VPNFARHHQCCAKPDAGDWLMIRRDYFASDYSPLNQVTKDNVKNLNSSTGIP